MEKLFRVQLKPGHPTGTYRRDGVEFTSRIISTSIADPITLTEAQVTEGMRSDPWLEVVEIEPVPHEVSADRRQDLPPAA